MYQNRIVEIDFKEWIWKLLSQWKAIIIVSIIMALLICGLKHHNDVQVYNASMTAKAEAETLSNLTVDEGIEQILLTLPEEDREKVLFVIHEKEWLNDQKKYVEESVLMNTNPANQRVLKIVFEINSEEESALPVLLHNYSVFSQGDKVCEEIKQYIANDSENRYISELFYNEEYENEINGNSAALCLNIVLPEDADAESVSKTIDENLSQYCKSLQSQYPHTIVLAESEETHIYHKTNVEEKIRVLNSINNLQTSIKSLEGELTARQSEAMNGIMAVKEATEEIEEAVDLEADNVSEADTVAMPGYSKKHAILGFVLGVFLYAAAYLIIVVLKGAVYSAASLETFTQSRLFGELYYISEKTGFSKLFRSKMINKLHYKDRLDINRQIEKTAKSIEAAKKHLGANSLALLSLTKLEEGTKEKEIIDQIKENANSSEGEIVIYDMSSDIDERSFLSLESAAIIVKDTTNYSAIKKLSNLCKEYGVNVLGNIFISDI